MLVNLGMMHQPVAMAEILDLEEYESMLWHWNEAHRSDDDGVDPPDADETRRRLEAINADPRLTGAVANLPASQSAA